MAYHIYMAVKRTQKCREILPRSGCTREDRPRLYCSVKGEKHLHLFDTFEGLPQVDEIDMVWPFYEGKFAASYDHVRDYLKNDLNVSFYKGVFPDTSEPVREKKFSMVNLDVDCYESTRQCLLFFYPR